MYWWSRFDLATARGDLRRIAAAGFRFLRFFLLWEAFQSRPDGVDERALQRLEQFADVAAELGLLLQPTLFTGHMSGANWLPEFATVPGAGHRSRFPTIVGGVVREVLPASFYADEGLIRAQALLAGEVARVLARHPAMWSWDLGNEPSNVATPPSREAGRRWLARMVAALRDGGSEHPVTIGLHMEDLEEDRRLGPAEAAEVCDYLCMHGYPLYARWVRHPLDATLLPFLGLVTQWLGGGRPVLFQELGLPTHGSEPAPPLFPELEGARFYDAALAELRRERFLGAFAWCAFDYAQPLWTLPPFAENVHERFFGLFRADGSPKPALDPWLALQRGTLTQVELPPRGTDWIDLDPAQFWRSPAESLRQLYARFVIL
jgi:endo-1,4-beta-mannosidase